MEYVNGYLLSNRVAEMLQQVEMLPHYVMIDFKKHFTEDTILASWIQYNTYPHMHKEDTLVDYIVYMFDKCREYDRKHAYLRLDSVGVSDEGNMYIKIEEAIF